MHESFADFYKPFKARASLFDTFGDRAGYHPVRFEKHKKDFAAVLGTPMANLTDYEVEQAMQSAC